MIQEHTSAGPQVVKSNASSKQKVTNSKSRQRGFSNIMTTTEPEG